MKQLSRRNFIAATAAGTISIVYAEKKYAMAEKAKQAILSGRGISRDEIDTPALILDLDAFEWNLETMAEACRGNRVGFRPHSKTHKCPEIARKQLESGALGICTAKTGEAEVMVGAGIENVLVTSPVVTIQKIKRLLGLRKKTSGLMVVTDSERNARDLAQAARDAGLVLDVLVDINPLGHRRTGIAPGEPAVKLAERIMGEKGLRFRGIQSYAGGVQHVAGFENRRQKSLEALAPAVETRKMMLGKGLPVEIFTGGGTGTYNIDHEQDGFTDIQVGSYIFMDVQYIAIGGKGFADEYYGDFKSSLTTAATAISQPVENAVTIDAGYKAFATDGPHPVVKDLEGITHNWAGDEHGVLTWAGPERRLSVGDRVELIVPHCDPTVNLYDVYYCVRDGRVEDLWEIAGRGKCQ